MSFTRIGLAALVIAIAVSTGCTEKKLPPVVANKSALADTSDQIMFGAHFNLTDAGLERAELNADTAFFFDDNTRIELRKVETTFYTASGARDAYLTSRSGTYNNRTSAMVARGNVVVITEEGRRLETPELKYNQQLNEISSDSAFVLTEPGRRLEGIGFQSDPNMQNIRILKTKSGSTGVVTLPGQQ